MRPHWLVIAFTFACSDSQTYSGTFSGMRNNASFSTTLTWNVAEDGTTLVGTFETADGTAGDVDVTLSGTAVTGFMSQTAPCPLALIVEGTFVDGALTGDAFTGPGTACQFVDASFEIRK